MNCHHHHFSKSAFSLRQLHFSQCAYAGERIARHNQLRDVLHQTATQAALGPAREERALLPGSESRPADVLIPNWVGGRDAALDVTVVSPLQQALVDRAADEPCHTLNHAYQRKMRQSFEACNQEGISFIPLPVLQWRRSAAGIAWLRQTSPGWPGSLLDILAVKMKR